jgi:hypothetical protein
MAIVFECICGTTIEALVGQIGRKVMCPSCRSDLTVPTRSWSRPEVMPDLGIKLAEPGPLTPRRRRRRAPGVAARKSGVAPIGPGVALLVATLAGGWGLLSHQRSGPLPVQAGGITPAVVEVDDQVEKRRLARGLWEEARDVARASLAKKDEDRGRLLREASRLVLAEKGTRIVRSVVRPEFNEVAFLVQVNDGGSIYSYFVVDGKLIQFFGDSRFYWEVLTPESVAAMWAGEYQRDGPYVTKSIRKTDDPPSFDAVVVHEASGLRFCFRLLGFSRAGTPEFDMKAIDE